MNIRNQSVNSRTLFAIIVILFVAFALRIHSLEDRNIWWDEGYSIWISRLPLGNLVETTAYDVHPPLYYIINKLWINLAGDNLYVMRFASACIGLIGIAFAFQLGKEINGIKTALLTSLFVAISLFLIKWSQEVRMHILAWTLGTTSLYYTVRIWKYNKSIDYFLYFIITVCSLLTMYLSVVILLATNFVLPLLLLFKQNWTDLGKWVGTQFAVVIGFGIWLSYAYDKILDVQARPGFSVKSALEMYFSTVATGITINFEDYRPLTVIVWGIIGLGVVTSFPKIYKNFNENHNILMLVWAIIVQNLIVFAVGLPIADSLGREVNPRYFIVLITTAYVLLAWSIVNLSRKRSVINLFLVILVVGIFSYSLSTFYPRRIMRDRYLSALDVINAYHATNDAVLIHDGRDWPIFAAEYNNNWIGTPFAPPMTMDHANFVLEPIWQEHDGVWVVVENFSFDNDPDSNVLQWLRERAKLERNWHYEAVDLYFFARTEKRAQTAYVVKNFESNDVVIKTNNAELIEAKTSLARYPRGSWLYLSLYWKTIPHNDFQLVIQYDGKRIYKEDLNPPLSNDINFAFQQPHIRIGLDWEPGNYIICLQLDNQNCHEVENFSVVDWFAPGLVLEPEIDHSLDIRFGESITLLGYNISQHQSRAGEDIELTLFWQTDKELNVSYKIGTQLIGEWNPSSSNPLWAQNDSIPANWMLPTVNWVPNEIIQDEHVLSIDPNAPRGTYKIGVVIYDFNGQRLTVEHEEDTVAENLLIIGSYEIIE